MLYLKILFLDTAVRQLRDVGDAHDFCRHLMAVSNKLPLTVEETYCVRSNELLKSPTSCEPSIVLEVIRVVYFHVGRICVAHLGARIPIQHGGCPSKF